MQPASQTPDERWNDLFEAHAAAERSFDAWILSGRIPLKAGGAIREQLDLTRSLWSAARAAGEAPPAAAGLPEPQPGETQAQLGERHRHYLIYTIGLLVETGTLTDEAARSLLSELGGTPASLGLGRSRPKPSTSGTPRKPSAPPAPRRHILEILLDPRTLQWLWGFGGALLIIGIVIWLHEQKLLTPPVVSVGLGGINLALLAVGGWMLQATRYHFAGRALSLIACFVMPLNLWYYHANELVTLDGHLWLAAMVISGLYCAAAIAVRDERFVYIFWGGITLTGLLFLADLPPSPQRFWEITLPATLLVLLGLLAIHLERAFPEEEGPFTRRRFGLASFFSGHVLLAAGLLLVLGAQVAGDWLYTPLFAHYYRMLNALPSPIVNELRWVALLLVLAGFYGYAYSDLVVRRIGVYVQFAGATMAWALVLLLQILNVELGVDVLIMVIAVLAMVIHGVAMSKLAGHPMMRPLPALGALLPMIAVLLGVQVYFRAISLELQGVWAIAPPAWSYVGAMVLTAISCRVGAYVNRHRQPKFAMVQFFGTGAATLVAATALLAALGRTSWPELAPILMGIPILYVLAARFVYKDMPEEKALTAVSHVAIGIMLCSSIASVVDGMSLIERQPLNLSLALFFVEAAFFYAFEAWFKKHAVLMRLSAAMACGAVWQLLTYVGVDAEVYTLTFALGGVALLTFHRMSGAAQPVAEPLANAAFQSGNTLLTLSCIAGFFMGLSRLAVHRMDWGLVSVSLVLALLCAVSVAMVRLATWKRWYVVMSLGQAAIFLMGVSALSQLSGWQKIEIVSVLMGLLVLAAGHWGWYREQETSSDMVSFALFVGSLLLGTPLVIATVVDRVHGELRLLNELGFLLVPILLLTVGVVCRIRATTFFGAAYSVLWVLALLVYFPWSALSTFAYVLGGSGAILVAAALALTMYRDWLISLPDRVRRREGVFHVLNWR